MGNFDYLQGNKQYEMFSDAAIDAEKCLYTSPSICAMACRRAFELAVKWVYSADKKLGDPPDYLQGMIHNRQFEDIIGSVDGRILKRAQFLIKTGNENAHSGALVDTNDAMECLRILFSFIHVVDYLYGDGKYDGKRAFDPNAVPSSSYSINPKEIEERDAQIEALERRNKELSDLYTSEREKNTKDETRGYTPDDISEFKTRKLYIDQDLKLRGWRFEGNDSNVSVEYELDDMEGHPGQKGFADYVLWGKDGKPLAIIEAKRTSKDPKIGINQARLYADCLERKFKRRPVIYNTNGFETYYWDENEGPQRPVSGISSRDDLQRLINRRTEKTDLMTIPISDDITDRYYQKEAIRAVCQEVEGNIRKHLLVMATGTGKTRTVASLVDVLSKGGYVKNVLFLADRTALVMQAKESFSEYLPNMSLCNLCSNKDDINSRIVFSTYPTILNAIDSSRRDDGTQVFAPAHFDLIIIDESHRSIFRRYRAIFDYFDARLVGLTATPKSDVDHNTYDFFDKDEGIPTYAYDYETAVNVDHYLVPYCNLEYKLKFLEEGIHYDELSDSDKERYEDDFSEDGDMPEEISASAMNKVVFNADTIDKVLQNLMDHGIRIDGGDQIGKTIIFAHNKRHAEAIVQRFNALYPQYNGKFIDRAYDGLEYVQDVIDRFKKKHDLDPQIVVSVDMMDTGVDVRDCVNLVFFKKVRSKAKFWQMIGRGTRRYDEGIFVDSIDGQYEGKRRFLIFDYCGNFQFFREHTEGYSNEQMGSLSQRIFENRIRIAVLLQDAKYSDDRYQTFRSNLTSACLQQVQNLNDSLVIVSLERQYVNRFRNPDSYLHISETDKGDLIDHIAPLVTSDGKDEAAMYFDSLMYALIAACLSEGKTARLQKHIIGIAEDLKTKSPIPQVKAKMSILEEVTSDEFWNSRDIIAYERVRVELRGLMRFLDRSSMRIVMTNLKDTLVEVSNPDQPPGYAFEDYGKKVNRYIEEHKDEGAIYKLGHNIPMSKEDVEELTHIFIGELGTEDDYRREFGEEDFGVMIRKIVKLDHESVMKAFSEFINDASLNPQQIQFIRRIIAYIENEGVMDVEDLKRTPFDKPVGFIRMFDRGTRSKLISVINTINGNAKASGVE